MQKTETPNEQLIQEIKDLTTSTNEKYDNVQKATSKLMELLDNNNVSAVDFEEDGVNLIIDRDSINAVRSRQAKKDLENDGAISSPVLQDLAFIDRHDDDYFFVNGYDRVQLVTDQDVLDELEDFLDSFNEY